MDSFIAKVVIVGNGRVGKTALRQRYLGGSFLSSYLSTVGADFGMKHTQFNHNNQEFALKYYIWDLGGQPHFSSVRSLYYNGSHGILMVYDITDVQSINDLTNWFEELKKHLSLFKIPIIILGNKNDLRDTHENIVPDANAFTLADSFSKQIYDTNNKIDVFFTSALTGENVNDVFTLLGKKIIDNSNYLLV